MSNGNIGKLERGFVNIPSKEEFLLQCKEKGVNEESAFNHWEMIQRAEYWVSDQYSIYLDKKPRHSWQDATIWLLSIARVDCEPIHDWRDFQAIKNTLIGNEFEAIEVYPAESRLVDTINQYHLWVVIETSGDFKPRFPVGWDIRNVTSSPLFKGKQRTLTPA